jgi:hypothetical protein
MKKISNAQELIDTFDDFQKQINNLNDEIKIIKSNLSLLSKQKKSFIESFFNDNEEIDNEKE